MSKKRGQPDVARSGKSAFPVGATNALKQIANCLALFLINSEALKGKSDPDRIVLLDDFGFDRNSIASIIGTTPDTVSVRLSEAKKKSTEAKKKANP